MKELLIHIMILLPLFGALAQGVFPYVASADQNGGRWRSASKWVALWTSLGSSLCGIFAVFTLSPIGSFPETAVQVPWIQSYAIYYSVQIDGVSALPVLLLSIVFPILIAAEWVQKNAARGAHGLFLVLQFSLLGTVCSQDLFLLFFFWAISAVPFYFLVAIWGGEDKEKAAFHSIVSSTVGNALFFAAIILVYYSMDPHSFSLSELSGGALEGKRFSLLGNSYLLSPVAFFLIAAGLALRAPIWPLHGWFTRVADQALPSVFVAMISCVVPVAGYVFLRLGYSLFPETLHGASDWLLIVGVLNLLLGAISAFSQRDLKLLLAYVCLSEVGLLIIGLSSLSSSGVVGAIFHQLSMGLALAGFGLFANVVFGRTGSTVFKGEDGTSRLGGIASAAPVLSLVQAVFLASILGLPAFAGFVSHSLLIIGGYNASPLTVIVAGVALLFATYYLFSMYRNVFLGASYSGPFEDLNITERAFFFPLVGALILFGIYPKPLVELVRPAALTLLSIVN